MQLCRPRLRGKPLQSACLLSKENQAWQCSEPNRRPTDNLDKAQASALAQRCGVLIWDYETPTDADAPARQLLSIELTCRWHEVSASFTSCFQISSAKI